MVMSIIDRLFSFIRRLKDMTTLACWLVVRTLSYLESKETVNYDNDDGDDTNNKVFI